MGDDPLKAAAGEVFVVVGASGLIGAALVRRLLTAGNVVIGVARHQDGLSALSRQAGRLEGCLVDIADADSPRVLAQAIAGRQVRMAVNAARVAEQGNLVEVDVARVQAGVAVKVGGTMHLLRACSSGMGAGSRLVAFGGRLGFDPDPRSPVASVANAALASLIRQLAHVLGPRGATAHLVAPGPVDHGSARSRASGTVARDRDSLAQHSPLGRLPTPNEIAGAVLALLEPHADHLNGGTLLLDGGRRTAMP